MISRKQTSKLGTEIAVVFIGLFHLVLLSGLNGPSYNIIKTVAVSMQVFNLRGK